jgi:hypothetical protein
VPAVGLKNAACTLSSTQVNWHNSPLDNISLNQSLSYPSTSQTQLMRRVAYKAYKPCTTAQTMA